MSGEEDDYMSDAVLFQCGDTRPGLVSRETKRKYEQEESKKKTDTSQKTKPKKVMEAEKREEGLQNAIGSDNKGFALLAKMGYKPGMGIGKEGRKGRTEPVPLEVKACRKGLGHASDLKRRREEAIAMRQEMLKKRQKLNDQYQQDFRSRHRSLQMEKETDRDLSKSQSVCYQLDVREGITQPVQSFYWKEEAISLAQAGTAASTEENTEEQEEYEEDELEEDDFTSSEKLQMLTSYLRHTYFYCVWCGTQYDDEEDMESNCPGDTSADHND